MNSVGGALVGVVGKNVRFGCGRPQVLINWNLGVLLTTAASSISMRVVPAIGRHVYMYGVISGCMWRLQALLQWG